MKFETLKLELRKSLSDERYCLCYIGSYIYPIIEEWDDSYIYFDAGEDEKSFNTRLWEIKWDEKL